MTTAGGEFRKYTNHVVCWYFTLRQRRSLTRRVFGTRYQ